MNVLLAADPLVGRSAHPAFIDTFTIVLVLVCAVLTAIDWLIGANGRKRLREAVGEWWLYVEYSTFGEAFRDQTTRIRRFYRRILRRDDQFGMQLVAIGACSVPVFLLITGYCIFDPKLRQPIPPGMIGYDIHSFLVALFVGVAVGYLSVRLTDFALQRFSSAASISALGSALAVWIAACLLTLVALILGVVGANYFEFAIRPVYERHLARPLPYSTTLSLSLLGRDLHFSVDWLITIGAAGSVVTTTIIPFVPLMFVTAAFFVAKTFRRIIKPSLSLVLQRFYESEKGVLTTLAIGGGASLKIVQEVFKYVYGR